MGWTRPSRHVFTRTARFSMKTLCFSVAVFSLCLIVAGCGRGPATKAALCHVTINTTPEQGAELTIDGDPRGQTPVSVEDLAPGNYEAIVKKANFVDNYQHIEIKPGDAPQIIDIPMEPFVGYLSLDSDPDGAEVYVDGELIGKTPIIQKAFRVGKHTYELKLADHYPASEEIEFERNYKYDKKHELKPIEAGLQLTSRPTGALIFINNEQQGQNSPAKFTLPAGTYLVGVWAKGYVQEEQKVVLEPNKVSNVDLTMKEGDVPQGMVLIPEGEFIWGSDTRAPDESPRRSQTLKAYYIDKYEVTNAQFKEVFHDFVFPKGKELHPAAGVSWNQAIKYAQAVGKRLPSEAEWEKAARGPEGREYPWGDAFNPKFCNTSESEVGGTSRVGEHLEGASPYGLMDAAGNVAEWTFDWYDRYPGNRDVTKDYGQVYRVIRGGSYLLDKFDARSARRHFDKVDSAKPDYGFRCAKDVEVGKK